MTEPRMILASQLDEALATEDPLQSLYNQVCFSSRDWGSGGRDAAWIYGIVVGWDDDPDDPLPENEMEFIAKKFRWPPEEVARLRRLHAAFTELLSP